MASQQANRAHSGTSILDSSVEGSKGTQAKEAQEALPMPTATSASRDTTSWGHSTGLLSVHRYELRKAAISLISQGSEKVHWRSLDANGISTIKWSVQSCDCISCEKDKSNCVQCNAVTTNSNSVVDKLNNKVICLDCFEYYFTLLQLSS